MVLEVGLEPTRPFKKRRGLNPPGLPVPPFELMTGITVIKYLSDRYTGHIGPPPRTRTRNFSSNYDYRGRSSARLEADNLEHATGFEPAFSTPITFTTFVAPLG